MLPLLLPLAITLVPKLIELIAGDSAGKIATQAAAVVQQVTGTTDPIQAQAAIDQDPHLALQLHARLTELSIQAEAARMVHEETMTRLRNAAVDARHQEALDEIRAYASDTANARSTMVGLAQSGSLLAWGAVVYSIIVAVGFFATLAITYTKGLSAADPGTQQLVGALTLAFGAVSTFWIGSSSGSHKKDYAIQEASAAQAEQTTNAINSLSKVATTVATSTPQTPAVIQAPVQIPIDAPPVPSDGGFDRCVAIVFAQEGGYADSPADSGGATNMGITLATLSRWRNQPCTARDVHDLTKSEATEIYRSLYWNRMCCGDLPSGVDLEVFDMGVNAGPGTAVKILQRIVGVLDDGSIGPRTLDAVAKFGAHDLIAKFSDARLAYYRSLANWGTFANGWTRRVTQIRIAAEAMAA